MSEGSLGVVDVAPGATRLVHRLVCGELTIDGALAELTELATEALPAAMAGFTVRRRGRLRTLAPTDEAMVQVDQAQYDAGRGPSLQCLAERRTVVVHDLEADGPFPEFRAAAQRAGMRASLAVPLTVGETILASLDLLAAVPRAFDDAVVEHAELLAQAAAIAAAHADQVTQVVGLRQAMQTRATIEQAKGIIMAAQGSGPEEAFEVLREQSQAENRKLRDLAQDIVRQQQQRSGR